MQDDLQNFAIILQANNFGNFRLLISNVFECIEADQDFICEVLFLFCFKVEPCYSLLKGSHFASSNMLAHIHPRLCSTCSKKNWKNFTKWLPNLNFVPKILR